MARAVCLLCAIALAAVLAACGDDPPSARDVAAEHKAIALLSEERFRPPPGWQWGRMTNADGAHLRYGHADPSGPSRGAIVLAPGYASPAEEFFETARDFLKAGYAVWILDRRGQGGSDRWPHLGQRGYLSGLGDEARDLSQFAHLVKSRSPRAPLFLTGESLGGVIGLKVLHDNPQLFAAAAFSSPGINFLTGNFPRERARMLTSFLTTVGFGGAYIFGQHDWRFNSDAGGQDDIVTDDRERALATEGLLLVHPELREGGFTNGFLHELFNAADVEQAKDWLAHITTPVLMGMTPEDKIAMPSAIVAACARMPACTLVRFPGARHALFSDADPARSHWMEDIVAFLDGRRTNYNPS